MKILCNPGNVQTAKSYPYWDELYELLKDHEIKKISGILPLNELKDLVEWADVVITIDSFLPHFIEYYQIKKKVIVIWSKSDPIHFGYPHNLNLVKDKVYFRSEQFKWWIGEPLDKDAFILPIEIIKYL